MSSSGSARNMLQQFTGRGETSTLRCGLTTGKTASAGAEVRRAAPRLCLAAGLSQEALAHMAVLHRTFVSLVGRGAKRTIALKHRAHRRGIGGRPG